MTRDGPTPTGGLAEVNTDLEVVKNVRTREKSLRHTSRYALIVVALAYSLVIVQQWALRLG